MRGRPSGSQDGGLVDVEIVEDDDRPAEGPPRTGVDVPRARDGDLRTSEGGAGAHDHAPRRPALRRSAWVAVAGVLALVIGVNVIEARRTAAEDAALATLPGVVGSLEDPVGQVWRSRSAYPVTFLDHIMVAETSASPSPSRLEAVDVRSGERLWEMATELGADRYRACSPWWDWERGFESDATSLMCVVHDLGAGRVVVPATVELVDIRTGDVLGAFDLEGQPLSHQRHGDDLVAAWVDDARRVVAVRLRTDGTEVWRTTSDPVAREVDLSRLSTGVYDDALVAEVQDVSLEPGSEVLMELDLGTGERVTETRTGRVPVWEDTVELASAYRVTTRYTPDTTTTVVEDPDGAQVLEAPGWHLTTEVDDGSAPGVVLVNDPDGALTAHDVESGAVLWSLTGATYQRALLRLRSTVVLTSGTTASAVDLRTGEELWDVDGVRDAGGVTDGRRVLLARLDDGGGLSAYDLRDGSEVWRTALPGVEQLVAGPGVVVVRTSGGLVVLR